MRNLSVNNGFMGVRVRDIRVLFQRLKEAYPNGNAPGGMLEVIGAHFMADEETIFGPVNYDYVERELTWYHSQSLNVGDIPGAVPKIWQDIADKDGFINSNYGYLIWSRDNESQFERVLETLQRDPNSRQGTMVYTRPTIHDDAYENGKRDFICTNAVNYFVRDGLLHAVVQMRSNDVVFGYRNDYAWQRHVQAMLAVKLGYPSGEIMWNAASLHVYPRHFDLIPTDA